MDALNLFTVMGADFKKLINTLEDLAKAGNLLFQCLYIIICVFSKFDTTVDEIIIEDHGVYKFPPPFGVVAQ